MKQPKGKYLLLLVAAIVTFAQLVYIVHHHAENDHCEEVLYDQQHDDSCILCDVILSFPNTDGNKNTVFGLIWIDKHQPSIEMVQDAANGQFKNRAPPLFS